MKEIILNFLATKSNRQHHSLNLLIKGNFKTKTREDIAEIKRTLRSMKDIEFNGVDLLDSVNNNGHNQSDSNGMAMPTQYHNFDSVNVTARGMRDVTASPIIPKMEPFVYTPMPKPADRPIVDGHPILDKADDSKEREAKNKELHDQAINGSPVEVLSEQLSKNGIESVM